MYLFKNHVGLLYLFKIELYPLTLITFHFVAFAMSTSIEKFSEENKGIFFYCLFSKTVALMTQTAPKMISNCQKAVNFDV